MFTFEDVRNRSKDEREMIRAQSLATRGVAVQQMTEDEIRAVVHSSGDEPYQVTVRASLEGDCTCQSFGRSHGRKFCKHVGAVALYWLGRDEAISIAAVSPAIKNAIDNLSDDRRRLLLEEFAGLSADAYRRIIEESQKP